MSQDHLPDDILIDLSGKAHLVHQRWGAATAWTFCDEPAVFADHHAPTRGQLKGELDWCPECKANFDRRQRLRDQNSAASSDVHPATPARSTS